MDNQASATIIPFPVRRRGDLVRSAERLSEALTDLSAALVAQRDAMQRWREALLVLSKRMEQIGTGSA